MYSSLLVPLDGSRLAERALPFAMKLARATGGQLLLVKSVSDEVGTERPAGSQPGSLAAVRADIQELANSLCSEGVPTQALVDERPPVEAIVEIARQHEVDLIVMSTHGRSGVDRWLSRSVAEQVLREAPSPVLLVPSSCDRAWSPGAGATGRRVLVPLDGTGMAEEALPAALAIAGLLGDELQLVQAVDPLAYAYGEALADRGPEASDEIAQSRSYLERQAEVVQRGGGQALIDTAIGSPVGVIADRARDRAVDAVVMVTHCRDGVEQLIFGTVAGDVLHQVRVPLLLLRPGDLQEPDTTTDAHSQSKPATEPAIEISLSPKEAHLVRLGLQQLLYHAAPDAPEIAALSSLLARVGDLADHAHHA